LILIIGYYLILIKLLIKPLTADYSQRKVGLQKGQNQLILERLKQKYVLDNDKRSKIYFN